MKVLITGGAGFVGSALARHFRRKFPYAKIVAFDNLKRRGSESNLALFKSENIQFHHGDVRIAADLDELEGNFDLFIEASAETSVSAGLNGNPRYCIDTNLLGTVNCLEFARRRAPRFIFLSTSRVYSSTALRDLPLTEEKTRFTLGSQNLGGIRAGAITEDFSTGAPRSLYGTSKLAAESLVLEYHHQFGLDAVVNRCGVIAGPGQFGNITQGVFTYWVLNHMLNAPLSYRGFGSKGKQVRDILHINDLASLLDLQSAKLEKVSGKIFNVGGGIANAVSLIEYNLLCRQIVKSAVTPSESKEDSQVDIPYYVTCNDSIRQALGWQPTLSVNDIVTDIFRWLKSSEEKPGSRKAA